MTCGSCHIILTKNVFQVRASAFTAPHSPDLNPLDFYLWGFLKDKVYKNNPQTVPELKAAIEAKVRAISKEECVRVVENQSPGACKCTMNAEART